MSCTFASKELIMPDNFEYEGTLYVEVYDDVTSLALYEKLCVNLELTNCKYMITVVTLEIGDVVLPYGILEATMSYLGKIHDSDYKEFVSIVDNCSNPSIFGVLWKKIVGEKYTKKIICDVVLNAVTQDYKFFQPNYTRYDQFVYSL